MNVTILFQNLVNFKEKFNKISHVKDSDQRQNSHVDQKLP